MILKKVTGTLVTLKRLASVQEQRIHPGAPIGITRIGVSLLFLDCALIICLLLFVIIIITISSIKLPHR